MTDLSRACKIHNHQLYWRMFEDTGPWDFYGICGNSFKIDVAVFEAFEAWRLDDYRSYFDCLQLQRGDGLIFFNQPVAKVFVRTEEDEEGFIGWVLVDEDDHEWLRFGTDYSEDYYPCFRFIYQPKESA
jgi:hypothetical protein